MATALINNVNYSWVDITVIGLGAPFIQITKISYKSKQAKTNNYGKGAEPVSRGYGKIEYEASMELYTDEWKRIIAASPERDPLKMPAFEIRVTFAAPGTVPTTDVLNNVEFLENPFDGSEGDEKLLVTIPLIIAGINR